MSASTTSSRDDKYAVSIFLLEYIHHFINANFRSTSPKTMASKSRFTYPDQGRTDKRQSIRDHKLNVCIYFSYQDRTNTFRKYKITRFSRCPSVTFFDWHVSPHTWNLSQLDTGNCVQNPDDWCSWTCLHCSADHTAGRDDRDLRHIRCAGGGRGRGDRQVDDDAAADDDDDDADDDDADDDGVGIGWGGRQLGVAKQYLPPPWPVTGCRLLFDWNKVLGLF